MKLTFSTKKLKCPTIAHFYKKTASIHVFARYLTKYALHPKVNSNNLDAPDALMHALIRVINTEVICLVGKQHGGACSKPDYKYCEPEVLFRAYVERMINGTKGGL